MAALGIRSGRLKSGLRAGDEDLSGPVQRAAVEERDRLV